MNWISYPSPQALGRGRVPVVLGAIMLLATLVRAADTWTEISGPLLDRLKSEGSKAVWPGGCSGVVTDRLTGEVIIKIVGCGLWRSADQGKTWQRIDSNSISGRDETGWATSVDQNAPTRMASFSLDGSAGWTTDGRNWKSFTSLGRNWDFGSVDWGVPVPKTIVAAKHETNPPGEVYVTTDGGIIWKKLSIHLGENRDRVSMVGALDAATLVYSNGDGIYRSTDTGSTWTKVSPTNPQTRIPVLFRGAQYLGSATGLLVSKDKGASWQPQGAVVNIWQGPFFGQNEKEMVVVGKDGVFVTQDSGETWTRSTGLKPKERNFEFSPNWFGCYAWDPLNKILYASAMGNPVYSFELGKSAKPAQSREVLAGLTPLSVSANHRYLQDAAGTPFFLVGDCPQNLPLKLAISEFDGYMAECASRGFNLLWICIDGQRGGEGTTQAPLDRANHLMMTNGWDIGTLNDAYFVTIDAILHQAQLHGVYCMLTPLSECQWTQGNINRNSEEAWHNYGLYLGKRYRHQANIIWQLGNDDLNEMAQHAIVQGIKEAGDSHLMTVNWRPGYQQLGSSWVRKHQYGESWIDLDAWYENAPTTKSGAACYWQKIEYERTDPMPSFQTEGPYQLPDPKGASDLDIRMQNYYVALGGGCGGHVYGAGWLADQWDYEKYKNNGGRVQTIHFKNLFVSREWTTLVPDYGHTFITAGYGTLAQDTLNYVGAAINSGTLGMAYCPKAATITADLSKFSGPVRARWYDPTDGTFKNIDRSPLANSGSPSFTTPGTNRQGDFDWVLVLETGR